MCKVDQGAEDEIEAIKDRTWEWSCGVRVQCQRRERSQMGFDRVNTRSVQNSGEWSY